MILAAIRMRDFWYKVFCWRLGKHSAALNQTEDKVVPLTRKNTVLLSIRKQINFRINGRSEFCLSSLRSERFCSFSFLSASSYCSVNGESVFFFHFYLVCMMTFLLLMP